ncbi:MAG: T9SS type A sorting domain-containing protein [Bacteroidetes bacterium]|nr:T9SS type A sorting domain-containing protein [Bacteroidota bacterium]
MKARLFTLLLLLATSYTNISAQYKNGAWGINEIPGQNTTAPMVLFNRPTLKEDTAYVKNAIRSKTSPIFDIYQQIINEIASSFYLLPDKGSIEIESDRGTEWAKNAAFVYFMNIDTNGIELTPTFRDSLKHEALEMLYKCNARRGENKFESSEPWDAIQQHIAADIINMCITYELLRAGGADNYLPGAKNELQIFVGAFYKRASGLSSTLSHYLNNNLTLRSAAALGMASVVLHDRGAGIFRHNYKPKYWASKAHARIRQTMFSSKRKTQAREINGESSGYFEGPGYFAYAAELMLPFFVAYDNFVDNKEFTKVYTEANIFAWNRESVTNYKYNVHWQMMFGWFNSIVQPKGIVPTYDDSSIRGLANICTFAKDKKYSLTADENLINLLDKQNYNARADVLAYNNFADPEIYTTPTRYYSNGSSGNFLIKTDNRTPLDNSQYLHFLCEPEINADNWLDELGRIFRHGHEHPDHGSFTISAGKEMLAIDPPYMGYSNRYLINYPHHHNIVTVNGEGPDYGIDGFDAYFEDDDHKILTFKDYDYHGSNYQRKITLIDEPDNYYYYELEDEITSRTNSSLEAAFYLHGNGNYSGHPNLDTTADISKLQTEHSVIWKYPCEPRPKTGWKLYAKTEVLSDSSTTFNQYLSYSSDGGNSQFTSDNSYNGYEIGGRLTPISGGSGKSDHTVLKIKSQGKKIRFHTLLIPLPCSNDTLGLWKNGKIGKVDSWQSDSFNCILVNGIGPSNFTNLHFKSMSGANDQTVINPFKRSGADSNQVLEVSGTGAFFSVYPTNSRMQKSCTIATRFHETKINLGTKIKLNDTVYLEANKQGTYSYKIIGKLKYKASAITTEPTNLKFYIPDFIPGFRMTVKEPTIYSVYNDTTHYLTVTLPDSGRYSFYLELEDPCLVSCYFPPTIEKIDSIFNFNDGTNQNLSHKLDIVKLKGNLTISNGSQMEISCNKYLRNQDSLILIGECDDSYQINLCEGIGNSYMGKPTSAIIVNSGSALVLDNGSYTYIGNGCAIFVKPGGTLILKNGSFLQVGDDKSCGKGQLIVERGACVYIQPYAHIEFYKKIADTLDRHIINIPSTVYPGVNLLIDSLLLADQIIDSMIYPISICSLDSVMNPAVYNNDWGYASFMPPVPNIHVRKDTICPGEPLIIDLNRILNDNKFGFEICKVDSYWVGKNQDSLGYWQQTCIMDTMLIDTIDPEKCYPPNSSGDRLVYYFETGSLHRVTIHTGNECGIQIDSVRYVYVRDTSDFGFEIPKTACSGVGSVKAEITKKYNGNYAWSIDLIDTVGGIPFEFIEKQSLRQSYHKEFSGLMPDTFDFPDFDFLGGYKYLITLSIKDDCFSFYKYDTISIPTGAFIKSEKPTAYASPLQGARSVQLHGFVSLADSFSWWPTTYLNRSDTLVVISTPEDPIAYVLQAFSGSCMASDTLEIRYNRIANAGEADTVCLSGNEIVIGNGYDASLFLGYLFFKGRTEFRAEFIDETTTDNAYFQDFTRFMHTESFKDWIQNCGNLKDEFSTDLLKEVCIKKPWFGSYFKDFYSFSNENIPALDDFVNELNSDSVLNANFDNTGDWASQRSCIPELFARYDNFKSSNVNDYSISWTKISGEDTLSLLHYSNLALAIDSPWQTTVYIQQAITPTYAEFDETITYVDTLTEAGFIVAFQMDSSVYFENVSIPESNSNSYSWNFGDGTSSTSKHAFHTYPKFDTSYLACLQVTNQCGSFMYCDTVYIDSAHWNYMNKVTINTSPLHESIGVQQADNLTVHLFPNPAESQIFLSYQSTQENFEGRLIITDSQGKQIWETVLVQNQALIKLPSESWNEGLYVFKLQNQFKTKQGKFVLMR